jgi:phosphate transport system substrate-binding protein
LAEKSCWLLFLVIHPPVLKRTLLNARRLLALLGVAGSLCGCGPDKGYIKIKGSETVLPIALKLAESFSNDPNLPNVSVTAGGSGVGIAALMQDNTDIAMASRSIKFSERVAMQQLGYDFEEVTIAFDALAIIAHPTNPVDTLTTEQLKGIYTGAITNWNQVGGADLPIVPFNRESSSGTYEFFKQAVLKGDLFASLQTVGANGELVEKITTSPQGIGYVGIAFVDPQHVKLIRIWNPELQRSVPASIESAMDHSYPLNRPLFFYYLQRHAAKVKPVINYIRSRAGQEMVRSVNYPPNPIYYLPAQPEPTVADTAAADTARTDSLRPDTLRRH